MFYMWSLENFLFWMDGLERLGSTGQELLDQRLSISGCMELGELESSGQGFQICLLLNLWRLSRN